MSTLERERAGHVTVRPGALPDIPDHVPAALVEEHPDAARVVAGRVSRPVTRRVVDRGPGPTWARLALALGASGLVAPFVGGGADPDPVEARTPTPPAALRAERSAADELRPCGPGAPVVLRCGAACLQPVPPTGCAAPVGGE